MQVPLSHRCGLGAHTPHTHHTHFLSRARSPSHTRALSVMYACNLLPYTTLHMRLIHASTLRTRHATLCRMRYTRRLRSSRRAGVKFLS